MNINVEDRPFLQKALEEGLIRTAFKNSTALTLINAKLSCLNPEEKLKVDEKEKELIQECIKLSLDATGVRAMYEALHRIDKEASEKLAVT